jgi:hypothetical protein
MTDEETIQKLLDLKLATMARHSVTWGRTE